jgi:hypothetical protein
MPVSAEQRKQALAEGLLVLRASTAASVASRLKAATEAWEWRDRALTAVSECSELQGQRALPGQPEEEARTPHLEEAEPDPRRASKAPASAGG